MKTYQKISLLAVFSFLLLACDKKELEDYSGPDSIYFEIQRDHAVSFLERPGNRIDTTFRVLSLGTVTSYERTFKLVVDEATTLVKGTHFDVDLEYKMPAGKAQADVPLILYRHPDLQDPDREWRLVLRFVESQDFNIDFKQISGIDILTYSLNVSDRIERPSRWKDEPTNNFYKYYGKYSLAKLLVLMEACQKPSSFFNDIYNTGVFQATSRATRLYLERQNPKIKDEDGSEMKMGEFAL